MTTTNQITPVRPKPDTTPPRPKLVVSEDTVSGTIERDYGLGHTVCWITTGRWMPDTVKDAAIKGGIDQDLIDDIGEIPARTAALRAKDNFNRKNTKKDVPRKAEIVKSGGNDQVEVAILERDNENPKRPWKLTNTVYVNNDKGTKTTPNPDYGQIIGAITPEGSEFEAIYHNEKSTLTGNDIYTTIIKPTTERARRIPMARGLYFISKKYTDKVVSLKVLCRLLGIRFKSLTLMNDQDTKETVQIDAREEIEKNITKVKEALKVWEGKDNIQQRSQDRVLEELAELLSLAEEVRVTLEVETEDLIKAIELVKDKADDIIDGKNNLYTPEQLVAWQAFLNPSNADEVTSNGCTFIVSRKDIPGFSEADHQCLMKLDHYMFALDDLDGEGNNLIMVQDCKEI
ncbi:MAG TPA: hypothetical protein EYN67_00810 [Flavobacteriales bacterium]|nr:hypothetical protein [Flavobacteriales bacterium]